MRVMSLSLIVIGQNQSFLLEHNAPADVEIDSLT